jgi:homoserine dehydrogenase
MTSRSPRPLKIAIAGLGTVGGGLLTLARTPGGALASVVEVVAVSARNRDRARSVDLEGYRWFDDPVGMAAIEGLDVFVELIGGSQGPARDAVEAALSRGVDVVTANKALLAEHGAALAALAEANGAQLRYEAAVAGGVPAIKALREGLSANRVSAVSGILNGTCNYILTEMEQTGRGFGDVLADAQKAGYAEADPSFDVKGLDAGHKVSILAALAFGTAPDFAAVRCEGIEAIDAVDLAAAREMGRRIRLVAYAALVDGKLDQAVRPELLALDHPLASVFGPTNAVVIDAEPVGRITLVGSGAGAGPTASAVAADLLDLAHGGDRPVFAGPAAAGFVRLLPAEASPAARFYLRLRVKDRPGVIASIAEALAKHDVSIESMVQKPVADAASVPIVLTVQACPEAVMRRAVAEIAALESLAEHPCLIRIEG